MVVDSLGQEVAKQTYLPFGETWGSSVAGLPTDYTFTGQREATEIGLMYYVARWYDSEIGQFIQADTIVLDPYNPMDWNHYAYAHYSPLNYVDPSGHSAFTPPSKNVRMTDGSYDFNFKKVIGQPPDSSWLENDRLENQNWFDEHNQANWKREIPLPFEKVIGIELEVDDIFDLYVDSVGIVGDIFSLATYFDLIPGDEIPGFFIWATSEGVELVGIFKGMYDATHGDFSNLLYDTSSDQILETTDKFAELTNNPALRKLIPGFGIIFNIGSISQNYSLNITIEERNK